MMPDNWKPAIEQAWRDNLKKGDDVIISSVIFRKRLRKVHRVTPSQIIIMDGEYELRYLKRNGQRLGPSSGWIIMPEVTP